MCIILFTLVKFELVLIQGTVTSIKLTVDGETIESVKCFKFLGFYLDQNLTSEHQAFHVYENLLNSVFLLYGSFRKC